MSRHDYTVTQVRQIHDLPIPELVFRAQGVHREHHPPTEVQLCSLLSVKTGGCPEDCAYCTQSSRYETGLERQKMMKPPEVLEAAARAKAAGASRFCMGAAWREVKDGAAFDDVLTMVRGVRALGMEACCTLGMLTEEQAKRLGEA
ncbi:MAG: biotin synthase, partial [Verrucomicrobiota bacterium]